MNHWTHANMLRKFRISKFSAFLTFLDIIRQRFMWECKSPTQQDQTFNLPCLRDFRLRQCKKNRTNGVHSAIASVLLPVHSIQAVGSPKPVFALVWTCLKQAICHDRCEDRKMENFTTWFFWNSKFTCEKDLKNLMFRKHLLYFSARN